MSLRPEDWSARLPLVVGFAAVVLLVGGISAWSYGTRIAGAVVAPGTVRVESNRQVVQHPDGGVVGEIHARDGDRVMAGDVLVRLDGTFMRSELELVERQLLEIHARRLRLEAERDGAEALADRAPPAFDTLGPAEAESQIAGQRSLFEARRASLAQETRQLAEQQLQIEAQIDGAKAQLAALERQLALLSDVLVNFRSLSEEGLVQATRLLELQREEAQLQGEIGRITSSEAEARTRISEIDIAILRLTDDRREEAITQLRDLQYSAIEYEQRRLSLAERIARLGVRAPVGGVVFGSRIFAVQSVVQPAEPMMYIVPEGQPLQVSVRIDPVQIDKVYPGQDVSLMFTAFSRRTTPQVPGTVLRVSADVAADEATGRPYFEAVVVPDPEALGALDGLTLVPGMPVEVFLRTDDRTPLSYLAHPLAVYFNRAFREE